ncbi:site-specific integrase [Rhizobium sp. BK602]|uniref:tyrosine-type recombinase/integrase n=1 Tax=Rhizobium sp. BK602 TaxID=2586986 RepID=UPI00161289F4|nr:site-specific integrase [Rhizobium sp. BK602]MBB3608194.1 integrase [Rhizobium sp. BK602]
MATLRLTSKSLIQPVKVAIADQRSLHIWDTELSGFGCYISPKGKISWLVQRWTGGRESGKATRQVIGKGDLIDLQEARQIARRVLLDIDSGIDVVERKREARKPKVQQATITVSEAIEKFSDLSAPWNSGRTETYLLERQRRLSVGLAEHLSSPLSGIQKADIRVALDKKETQSTRQALYAALSPFLSWCLENDLIEINPLASISAIPPVASRERVLTKPEIKALWSASYHMPDRWGSFYRLLLLTLQRREEVSGMHSSEIDFDKVEWTIPKERTKNGKVHIVHLSSMASAELAQAQGYIFPASKVRLRGEKTEAHISGYSKMKSKLDGYMKAELAKEEHEFKPWRVHDLRRTAASGLAEMGVLPEVIERILNHTSGAAGGLKAVYQRYEYMKERKEALEAWGGCVAELVGAKMKAVAQAS